MLNGPSYSRKPRVNAGLFGWAGFAAMLGACAMLLMASPAHASAPILYGDVNGDGHVNFLDAALAVRAAVGLLKLTPDQIVRASVVPHSAIAVGDGHVNVADALFILRLALGLDPPLPQPTPASLTVSVDNRDLLFNWQPATGLTGASLRFSQGSQQVVIPADQPGQLRVKGAVTFDAVSNSLHDDFTAFSAFSAGSNVTCTLVAGAGATPARDLTSITFVPLSHVNLRTFDSADLSIGAPPPATANVGDKIQIAGSASIDLEASAFVTLSDGSVEPFLLATGNAPVLSSGTAFQFGLTLDKPGVYTIEVNGTNGQAVLNTPVYVGGLPLLPTYKDHPDPLLPQTKDSATLRQEWLTIVNHDRTAVGLAPVTLDDKLTASAQGHTDDMVARNYFAHVTPEGLTPTDRARAAGVPAPISPSENLGTGTTPVEIEDDLLGSPGHRSILLDAEWTRVGLGISIRSNGELIGAQEFACYGSDTPALDTAALRTRFLTAMNSFRTQASLPSFKVDANLDGAAQTLTDDNVAHNTDSQTTSDGRSIVDLVTAGRPTTLTALGAAFPEGYLTPEDAAAAAASGQGSAVTDARYSVVGIGIGKRLDCSLEITLIFGG